MKNNRKEAFTRTCIACNSKKNKFNLIRIAYNKNNEISIDKTSKAKGRGVYLCYRLDCLDKAQKTKRMERKLRTAISEKFYEDIRGVIIDKEETRTESNRKQNGGDV